MGVWSTACRLYCTVLSILHSLFTMPYFQNEYVCSYKQSRRREDDLAIVNAGLRVLMRPSVQENGHPGWRVGECGLAYGGMSFKTVMATKTGQAIIGRFVHLYLNIIVHSHI